MIVGGAIGDALGAPVETWTPERIIEVHGEPITGYVPAIGHKWFKEETFPVGSITDDTQLTLATARGVIQGHKNGGTLDDYMDAIAAAHCKAMSDTTDGWGTSTREAVRRLQNNVHWSESGKSSNAQRGTGNGVPMKISPLAAVKHFMGDKLLPDGHSFENLCIAYSAMTHYSQMSAYAAIIHAETCVDAAFSSFCVNDFWFNVFARCDVSHLNNDSEDSLPNQMKLLDANEFVTIDQRRELFGNGSCYLFHSLPFAYSFLLYPTDDPLDVLLDVVNAGGDTDTNASMVGNIIGAMYGTELFEHEENKWAIDGLQNYEEIVAVSTILCDTLEIE